MQKRYEFKTRPSGNIFVNLIVNTLSIFAVSYLLPGVQVDSFITAIFVAVLLALLNATLRPILILFTLPITLFTFGFFLLVINAIMIFLVANWITGFEVSGFWWAVLFSILISIVNGVLMALGQPGSVRTNKFN
jgi:putative membrane protein